MSLVNWEIPDFLIWKFLIFGFQIPDGMKLFLIIGWQTLLKKRGTL